MDAPKPGVRLIQVHPRDINEKETDVDIIAVHGLDTKSPDTWTWRRNHDDPGTNWLTADDMLPSIDKGVRIFTCDWPAAIFQKSTSIMLTLKEFGTQLLAGVKNMRVKYKQLSGDETERPILFIASCLGGIILMEALLTADHEQSDYFSIRKATGGVVFLATPFRGTAFQDVANWAIPILRTQASLQSKTVSTLLDNVKGSTPELEELLVDSSSAVLDIVSEPLPLNRNHVMMNKFENSNDPDYGLVAGKIVDLLGAIRASRQQQEASAPDKEFIECMDMLTSKMARPGQEMSHIERRKEKLSAQFSSWILADKKYLDWLDGHATSVLQITGLAGTGKTMLMMTVIRHHLSNMGDTRMSYFFFDGTQRQSNTAVAFFRGLIYHLLSTFKSLDLMTLLRNARSREGPRLFDDELALQSVLETMLEKCQPILLFVDALDECISDLDLVLEFIRKTSSTAGAKWFISHRPEIAERLVLDKSEMRLGIELNAKTVSHAVEAYIGYKVSSLPSLGEDKDLKEQVRTQICDKANGIFLWAALVFQELKKVQTWDVLNVIQEMPPGLISLYNQLWTRIQKLHRQDPECCRVVLATAALAYRPVHLLELGAISGLPENISRRSQYLVRIVEMCGSFVTLIDDHINFIHQFAKDYLIENATSSIAPAGLIKIHQGILSRSLMLMSKTVKRDMYKLKSPGFPINRLRKPQSDPLGSSRYSCEFWIDHLCDGALNGIHNAEGSREDGGTVVQFLKTKYIYWLEALSLVGGMPQGVLSMARLGSLVKARGEPSPLADLVDDAYRFMRYYMLTIENNPLQVYASGLVFTPIRSLTRQLFIHEAPEWISTKPVPEDAWNSCLHTFEGHGNYIKDVVFSYDNKRPAVASASEDSIIMIWDVSTGQCLQTLQGHEAGVSHVVFSHNNRQLVSISQETVKIWDVPTGKCTNTLEPGCKIWAVSFSHDDTQLKLLLSNQTVASWDVASGECLQTLEGLNDLSFTSSFSDGNTLLASVSASNDKVIKIWDAVTGRCFQELEGHDLVVQSIGFSYDKRYIASGSDDETVKIWDATSGQCLHTCEGHSGAIYSVAFSHDNLRVVSGCYNKTIKIWDITHGTCLLSLGSHEEFIMTVAFSNDDRYIASGSFDNRVKIWDAVTSGDENPQEKDYHSDEVTSVAFSHDFSNLVSGSEDGKVKVWDVATGKCLWTFSGHRRKIKSVAFSNDNKTLASGSSDQTIKIWSNVTGKRVRKFHGHTGHISSVNFTHDNRYLVSGSGDGTVKTWDLESGECSQTLNVDNAWDGPGPRIYNEMLLTISHDDMLLAIVQEPDIVIWDRESNKYTRRLTGHTGMILSLALSWNNKYLAAAAGNMKLKIWDIAAGTCLRTYEIGAILYNISFDAVAAHLQTELGLIALDINSPSSPVDTPFPHRLRILGSGLIPDCSWITWNSKKLLWLPPEYRRARGATVAVAASTVAYGCASGRVLIFDFEAEKLPELVD